MTVGWIDFIPALIVALIGGGGWFGWRKLNAEAGSVITTTEASLRAQLRELDDELAEQRKRRMDLATKLEQAEVELRNVRHRVEKLEAWILVNTTTNPRNINGWRDTP